MTVGIRLFLNFKVLYVPPVVGGMRCWISGCAVSCSEEIGHIFQLYEVGRGEDNDAGRMPLWYSRNRVFHGWQPLLACFLSVSGVLNNTNSFTNVDVCVCVCVGVDGSTHHWVKRVTILCIQSWCQREVQAWPHLRNKLICTSLGKIMKKCAS